MSPKQQKILLGVVGALVVGQIITLVRLSSVSDHAYRAEFRGNQAESRAMNVENRLNAVLRDVNQLKLQVK